MGQQSKRDKSIARDRRGLCVILVLSQTLFYTGLRRVALRSCDEEIGQLRLLLVTSNIKQTPQ